MSAKEIFDNGDSDEKLEMFDFGYWRAVACRWKNKYMSAGHAKLD